MSERSKGMFVPSRESEDTADTEAYQAACLLPHTQIPSSLLEQGTDLVPTVPRSAQWEVEH